MSRNYVGWYKLKSQIENSAILPRFARQEIWWCSIGANIGDEEDGKNKMFERPVLVLRKYSKKLFFGLPMTSNQKNTKFYFPVEVGGIRPFGYVVSGKSAE